MSLTLVHKVMVDGQEVRFEGSTELTPELQEHELSLFITAIQEGVVVTGKWTIPAGTKDWSVTAPMGNPGPEAGPVTTTGLAVFQLADPVAFRTFTWTQNLEVIRASGYTKATS